MSSYVVLFNPAHDAEDEGKSWAIVQAESPVAAAETAGGHRIATDDKAYVVELGQPHVVYAKVGWMETQ